MPGLFTGKRIVVTASGRGVFSGATGGHHESIRTLSRR